MMYPYELTERAVTISSHSFRLRCIMDFERAVDQLFLQLEAKGEHGLTSDMCPYFGVLWPSGRALSRFIANNFADSMVGRNFLELGCGLGLPSMLATKLGANVLATDYHPDVQEFFSHNLKLNQLLLEYRHTDWRADDTFARDFDFIAGSDILYDSDQPKTLARFIKLHLSPGGTALVADPGRAYLQDFVSAMAEEGFDCKTHIIPAESTKGEKVECYVLIFSNP